VGDKVLGHPLAKLLGDFSFGAYLIHLLVMQPVIAKLVTMYGHEMSNPVRCAVTLAITLPIVYALAALTYHLVEVPGQKLGRLTTRRSVAAA
jgi:peptidoglycan/LPS O-acetylase OafA/YrhL